MTAQRRSRPDSTRRAASASDQRGESGLCQVCLHQPPIPGALRCSDCEVRVNAVRAALSDGEWHPFNTLRPTVSRGADPVYLARAVRAHYERRGLDEYQITRKITVPDWVDQGVPILLQRILQALRFERRRIPG